MCVSRSVLVPGDAHKEGTAGVCVCEEKGGERAESQRSHPLSRCCTLKPNCVCVCVRIWECVTKANSELCVSVSHVWNFDGL